ncbi:bifunctional folylpolyglutamate synthase/dihydrofolate synthase [Liquorilactobacillus satsumensis]|uniref:tetrahydrofolate synthase n=1 Tax=Liquorilactobacillus satsumensis DSM 16230 = JCM 12392 TaxID=1423801 RepID=A0A0R1V4H9_9LACO|nr:folylpolyglutamate synthase/dihydrofolate synthase family protein [Liquorilactobacillus satsumensis]KRL97986.1 folylpolyglutamate synthase dihydrofolate synthase [Liquorilactobacillus satsumensis DSM 16230 = JCM 12392]MCC7667523.1 bifunctional folylpolyglutamate synthase/dihydrofolate synthase [Liquorilactobacillus satsumensis]MCP9357053.1 bifunctional folylpolyglutamate synthase/dihydrofolate synthase [Liquorilactobacillus satsumensis]MCP9371000.1 bifunctional folylpolyglutamate synthase/di
MLVKNYAEALSFIHGRTKFKKSPTLQRMQRFVKALGHPEKQFPIIHITGTNGKGSTVAFLRELLQQQGLRVGTYTSPFIVKFNERIEIDGKMISDEEIVSLVNQVGPVALQLDQQLAAAEGGPTEFEILTAMMFVYFAKAQLDLALIEVGIGGTFDSTNVVTPLLSVITTVAYDHTELLGPTIASIAQHKAGIIKEGCPVVVGNVPAPALKVIRQRAATLNAPLYIFNEDYHVQRLVKSSWGEDFSYAGLGERFGKLHTDLAGHFQVENAAVAVTSYLVWAHQNHSVIKRREVQAALGKTCWPGRFEPVNQEPLIILDGAHNQAAIDELVLSLKQDFRGRHVYILIAILADKQPREMLAELAQLANTTVIATTFNGPRKVADVQAMAANNQLIQYEKQWQPALVKTVQQMSTDDVLLVTGSLYFISEVRQFFK